MIYKNKWFQKQMISRMISKTNDLYIYNKWFIKTNDFKNTWFQKWFQKQMISKMISKTNDFKNDFKNKWFQKWFQKQMISKTNDFKNKWFQKQMISKINDFKNKLFQNQMISKMISKTKDFKTKDLKNDFKNKWFQKAAFSFSFAKAFSVSILNWMAYILKSSWIDL